MSGETYQLTFDNRYTSCKNVDGDTVVVGVYISVPDFPLTGGDEVNSAILGIKRVEQVTESAYCQEQMDASGIDSDEYAMWSERKDIADTYIVDIDGMLDQIESGQ